MKLYLYADEKHNYVYADGSGPHDADARQVPDRLGVELMALREQEKRVLGEIDEHLRMTGQQPIG